MEVPGLPANCHKTESDFRESRPWWEPPYVTYGFSNPRVRGRLEKLMGSYVVRATDRSYMSSLQLRIREDHLETVRRRIAERELREVEREKRLILEGRMPMDEAPQELAEHPVFRITMLVDAILLERRRKEEEQMKRLKRVKRFDYSLLEGREEEAVEDTDLVECIEDLETDEDNMRKLTEMELYIAGDEPFSEEDYYRIKYQDPLVEELMEMETVDELYELAEEIVGPLSGRPCGGLLRQKK